jgi:hypothetical protein
LNNASKVQNLLPRPREIHKSLHIPETRISQHSHLIPHF